MKPSNNNQAHAQFELEESARSETPENLPDQFIGPSGDNPYLRVFQDLIVQSSTLPNQMVRMIASWNRRRIKRRGRLWLRLLAWPFDTHSDEDPTPLTLKKIIIRYILSCLSLCIVSFFPESPFDSRKDTFGRLFYKCTDYVKCPRNHFEREPINGVTDHVFTDDAEVRRDDFEIEINSRLLWPARVAEYVGGGVKVFRYTPIRNNVTPLRGELSRFDNSPIALSKEIDHSITPYYKGASYPPAPDQDFQRQIIDSKMPMMPFVFVSFTGGNISLRDNTSAFQEFLRIGGQAAKDNNCRAFWSSVLAFNSDADGEGNTEAGADSDFYKMSDIVRAAEEVVILVDRRYINQHGQEVLDLDTALSEWGRRLWTFPEILLSRNSVVRIYFFGEPYDPNSPPLRMNKYELADKAWGQDSHYVRQLLDHYEGSIHLSRIELSVLALRCLISREVETYMYKGDVSYVLRGLHRRRPIIDPYDEPFQAFAKLSMVSDSDRLMERLVCMLPPESDRKQWITFNDKFNTQLFDIEPECEIVGIPEENFSVILGGVKGAPIISDKFPKEIARADQSALSYLLCSGLVLFLIGLALVGRPDKSSKGGGAFCLVLGILEIFGGPYIVNRFIGLTYPQPSPYLLGFEGYVKLSIIEAKMYGRPTGFLQWDPFGSNLSRHHRVKITPRREITKTHRFWFPTTYETEYVQDTEQFSECHGIDPVEADPNIKAIVDKANTNATHNSLKVFTLINTATGLATLYTARHPPVAAISCGREGGMKRIVLCSFDWATNTLYRESVIRMEPAIADLMLPMFRFKFGFRRPD